MRFCQKTEKMIFYLSCHRCSFDNFIQRGFPRSIDRSKWRDFGSSFKQTFLPMKRKPVSDLYAVSNSFPSLELFLSLFALRCLKFIIVEELCRWISFSLKLHTCVPKKRITLRSKKGLDYRLKLRLPLLFRYSSNGMEWKITFIRPFDLPLCRFSTDGRKPPLIHIKLPAACSHTTNNNEHLLREFKAN